ncbi:MAG: NAD(+) synthase [Ancrocorticia sp.]|uniref:NAD(+) synthase n=1 Tax=Ancrocorticia sp. TaxID=2593684 RepID=UPI003F91AC6A
MDYYSIYSQGLARVAACTLPVLAAQPLANAHDIAEASVECDRQGVALAAFPELSLTGYNIDDLLLQDVLLDEVLEAIEYVRDASSELLPVIVVGAPLRYGNRIYNCAVVIHRGRVLGVVPKSYIPNYREFYEKRHFASGAQIRGGQIELPGVALNELEVEAIAEALEPADGEYFATEDMLRIQDYDSAPATVPFGVDLLFRAKDLRGFTFHVEVCEDMWVPVPPSAEAALAGASVLVNISGSPITVGRAADRQSLVQAASTRCAAAYLYTAAGQGESSTDLSWDGQAMVYELGNELASSDRFALGRQLTITDIDLDVLRQERSRQGTFDDNREALGVEAGRAISDDIGQHTGARAEYRTVMYTLDPPSGDIGLRREVARFPFVPANEALLNQDCYEAYNIQVYGITQRLRAIGNPKLVIGVSGGLDSTHALIVAARAMDMLGRPRTDILAYTLPGFATSDHTKNNAYRLAESLGVTFEEIDIRPAASQMLADMGHPFATGEEVYDVTFENVQAGLRTDFLFRLANEKGGIVLGTGDLSELALGWCTFGVGDQMSHYNVNPGVPKTLMQHLIRWVISSHQFSDEVGDVLQSIVDTEISPELVPAKDGANIQSTQQKIGPYELQDFTLYYLLRFGLRPSKIAFYEWHAWHDATAGRFPVGFPAEDRHEYTMADIKKWMELFLKRFFSNQFKRSTLPNGPKVVAGGTLSPRGDWRMPSDVSGAVWLKDLARVPEAAHKLEPHSQS